MRSLASIQRITSLTPIDGADKIEKAQVLGWEVVVKKGDFTEGDFCVYVEIDSILPDRPEFEFLRERKFRIKTIKLKGQVSQGICFPVDIIHSYMPLLKEGDDVTEILGIKKYDPQAEWERRETERMEGVAKNRLDKFFKRYKWYRHILFRPSRMPFPSFIKKTDEPRIQLFPKICETNKYDFFIITEKIDGQSGTYFLTKNKRKWQFWQPYIFGVCSRNFQLTKPDNSSYWDIARRLEMKKTLKYIWDKVGAKNHVVLQGEIIGAKIQNNKYSVSQNQFYAFNLIVDGDQKNHQELSYAYSQTVPLFTQGLLLDSIPEMVELSRGKSVLADIQREGIVCRCYDKNISFKVINPDFLLKYEC